MIFVIDVVNSWEMFWCIKLNRMLEVIMVNYLLYLDNKFNIIFWYKIFLKKGFIIIE